jgi:hypothetical protein
MKLKLFYAIIGMVCLWSCSSNDDITVQPVSVTFNFNHFWNGGAITTENFSSTEFTNENGDILIIDDVRYLISDIIFTHESGIDTRLNEYNLVDVDDETGLTFTTSANILPGEYTSVSFRFGFSEEDNIDEAYADLNTANFNVGDPLGGGYHYMQMDGTYIDENNVSSPFNFHVISAIDLSAPDPMREDTSFVVNLGPVTVGGNTQVNVDVDFFGWFESPNIWDLNQYDVSLMGNYDAQLLMNENGRQGVFSLESVTQ